MALRAIATATIIDQNVGDPDLIDIALRVVIFGGDVGELSGPVKDLVVYGVDPAALSVESAVGTGLKNLLINEWQVPFGIANIDTVKIVL